MISQVKEHKTELFRLAAMALALVVSRSAVLTPFLPFDVVALAATLLGGFPMFREAYEAVRERRMTMELSMTIAVVATLVIGQFFTGLVITFFVIFAEPVVRLFIQDPEVVPLGAACLRIVSYGNLGYAYFMVMMQAFNGAGDTITPTIVNFFGFWLLEIPLAYVLAMPLAMKSNGVFFSIAIAESSMAAASAILFKRGKWKQKKI